MQPYELNHSAWSSSHSISTQSTTCSIKLPTKHSSRPTTLKFFEVQFSQRSFDYQQTGLQRAPNKDLSLILRTDAAIKGIQKKSNSNKHNRLWPKAVLEAFDEAIAANNWEYALKIFDLIRKQVWYEPRCRTYTKLLMMLGKCRQPAQAELLFEVMLSEGLKPTIDVYTALISVYGKSGLFDKAFCTLEDMKSVYDCKPDVYTYSVLISCCIKFGCFHLMKRVMDEMSYLGISCSTVTYNTIIDGYGKAKLFGKMESALTDMIANEDSLPDVFTFNSIIGAYGNSGQIEKMEKWYNELQLMGVHPDVKTFNILIRSYGSAGMYEKMRSVLEFMKKRFFSPTIVTYNIIIDLFGRARNIEQMDKYFRKLKYLGIKPNSITYCSLVSAYSRSGIITKVDSILRQVENSDVVLDTPFFNCIISAYGQAGDLDKMWELFLRMEDRKCIPDNVTFATMIQAYKSHGMTEDARNLENRLIAAKGTSDARLISG